MRHEVISFFQLLHKMALLLFLPSEGYIKHTL